MGRSNARPERGRRIRLEALVAEWANATPGEHTITSRAVDTQGNIQPAMDDPRIAKKRTYWESTGKSRGSCASHRRSRRRPRNQPAYR